MSALLPCPAVVFDAPALAGDCPLLAAPSMGFEVVWSGDAEKPYRARWVGSGEWIAEASWAMTLAALAGLSAAENFNRVSEERALAAANALEVQS